MKLVVQKNIEFAESIRRRQRQQMRKKVREQQNYENYPLCSTTLEKFWDIDHGHLFQYLPEIQDIINTCTLQEGEYEEQENLIRDLIYLFMEHKQFKVPRKLKFLKNQSPQVASFVALVSNQLMPDELAFWLSCMSDQDKQLVYITITESQMFFLAWINHRLLKNFLLLDFTHILQAAKTLRFLIGVKQIEPSQFVTTKGLSIQFQLCRIFEEELEEMRNVENRKLMEEHMQITIWVLANNKGSQKWKDLHSLFNEAIVSRTYLLTSLFITWLNRALMNNKELITGGSLETILGRMNEGSLEISYQCREAYFERLNEMKREQLQQYKMQ